MIEEDDSAFTSAHSEHEPVVNMLEIMRPVVAHQLQYFEELLQV